MARPSMYLLLGWALLTGCSAAVPFVGSSTQRVHFGDFATIDLPKKDVIGHTFGRIREDGVRIDIKFGAEQLPAEILGTQETDLVGEPLGRYCALGVPWTLTAAGATISLVGELRRGNAEASLIVAASGPQIPALDKLEKWVNRLHMDPAVGPHCESESARAEELRLLLDPQPG